MLWTDLKGIQEPLRVGDVVILPGELSPPRFSIVFKCSMRRADGMLYSDWFLTWCWELWVTGSMA